MSCNNDIPLAQIVGQVKAAIEAEFITTERPDINSGTFTNATLRSPSIRGDILFDAAARTALLQVIGGELSEPPVVTGSRAGGQALQSLITALAESGLIVDNTET